MVDSFLKESLTKADEWIKFAEAKNAALLSFSAAVFLAIANHLLMGTNLDSFTTFCASYILVLLFAAIILTLLSFIPRLNIITPENEEKRESDNCLFFGHVRKYSPSEYLKLIDTFQDENKEYTLIDLAYAEQIVINSRIAYLKFKQFDLAVWFVLAAFTTPLGVLAVYYLLTKKH